MSNNGPSNKRAACIITIVFGISLFPMIAIQHINYVEEQKRQAAQQACYKTSSWLTSWLC